MTRSEESKPNLSYQEGSLSYQEKALYGTLIADLVVYGCYCTYVFGHRNTFGQIVGTIVVLVVVQIIPQSAIAIASRSRLTDERDRIIALRGYRAGSVTLVSVFLLGMGALLGPHRPWAA